MCSDALGPRYAVAALHRLLTTCPTSHSRDKPQRRPLMARGAYSMIPGHQGMAASPTHAAACDIAHRRNRRRHAPHATPPRQLNSAAASVHAPTHSCPLVNARSGLLARASACLRTHLPRPYTPPQGPLLPVWQPLYLCDRPTTYSSACTAAHPHARLDLLPPAIHSRRLRQRRPSRLSHTHQNIRRMYLVHDSCFFSFRARYFIAAVTAGPTSRAFKHRLR